MNEIAEARKRRSALIQLRLNQQDLLQLESYLLSVRVRIKNIADDIDRTRVNRITTNHDVIGKWVSVLDTIEEGMAYAFDELESVIDENEPIVTHG